MSLFAIADLHLPARKKPMDIFGPHWERHFERISEDWRSKVSPEDIVLLPGDLSWAMSLDEALEDLNCIGALPGRKILLRGNHDYWWSGIGRVRRALPDGMYALQNDAIELDGLVFAGTRGWTIPPEEGADPDDQRIMRIYPTQKGIDAEAYITGEMKRFHEACSKALTEDESLRMRHLLQKLEDAVLQYQQTIK